MPWTFYNSSGQRLSTAATNISVLDIDGATDIGAAIVDADLFIIDDGAGGTNRKTAASRIKTYIGGGEDISAHVTDASAQTISDNSRTAINFDTETYDTSSFHDNSTNNTRLTAPSDGKYIVSGGFYFSNATNSGVYGASIYKGGSIVNGTSMRTFPDVTSEHRYQNVTSIIQLDATEYVELIASLDAAGESVALDAAAFSIIEIA